MSHMVKGQIPGQQTANRRIKTWVRIACLFYCLEEGRISLLG